MPWSEILRVELRASKLEVDDAQHRKLVLFAAEVEHWNRSVNLTALRGAALVRRLIVDPICVGRYLEMSGVLADVGSGNGSPGIPLCMACSFSSAYLIEPRKKRAAFLRHVIAKAGLRGVQVRQQRIEESIGDTPKCDWITLQAMDPTEVVISSLKAYGKSTTTVVWLTSRPDPPVPTATTVEVPGATTKIWTFRLDQT